MLDGEDLSLKLGAKLFKLSLSLALLQNNLHVMNLHLDSPGESQVPVVLSASQREAENL